MIDLFIVQKVYQVCIMSTITLKSPYQVNMGTGYPPPSLRRELTEAYAATSYSLNDSLTHPTPCPISPMCSPWPASWPCSLFQYWSSLKPSYAATFYSSKWLTLRCNTELYCQLALCRPDHPLSFHQEEVTICLFSKQWSTEFLRKCILLILLVSPYLVSETIRYHIISVIYLSVWPYLYCHLPIL